MSLPQGLIQKREEVFEDRKRQQAREIKRKHGLTIFLSSHFMDEVEILCDRIGILKDGGFAFEGTVEEAVALSPYEKLEDAYLWFTGEEEEDNE